MPIEPLSTILVWVIGISVIIFIPFALISFIVLIFKMMKE